MELYDKIRILRKLKGWSQIELGQKLEKTSKYGLSRQAISDWETGKSEPKLDNIRELAELFDVSFDILLDPTIDLDDKETMNQVLHDSNQETKNKTIRSLVYYFEYFRLGKGFYVMLALFLLFLTIGLVFTFLNVGLTWFPLFMIVGGSFGISFSLLLQLIFKIINIIKKNGIRAGCITYNHLRIEAFDTIGTTIYVPIGRIEYMKILKQKKNFIGTIEIKVKDSTKPFILKDVYSPNKLITTYYEVTNPSKGLEHVELN